MSEEMVFFALEDGERLDAFASKKAKDLSRSALQKLITDGAVLLNDKRASKSDRLKKGDKVTIILPEPKTVGILPENIILDIVYEDSSLIVVNKPKGMVVHPAPGHFSGTLVNALLSHCGDSLSGINGVIRPGIVHRIDKDTSGLLVAAKDDFTHRALAAALKEHDITREYYAVVTGSFKDGSGTIDLPIGRSSSNRKKQAVNGINARRAVTHYETLETYPFYSLVKFTLETGRTHQIRVHCAHFGHAIAGDTVYGGKKGEKWLDGQCLHAKKLGFIHPKTNEYMEFDSPLPEYFTDFLNRIKNS